MVILYPCTVRTFQGYHKVRTLSPVPYVFLLLVADTLEASVLRTPPSCCCRGILVLSSDVGVSIRVQELSGVPLTGDELTEGNHDRNN